MEETKETTKTKRELSYDELKNVCSQLSQQLQQANIRLQQANMQNVLARLDFLFKVLEFKDCFNSDFVISCSDEITKLLTMDDEGEGDEAPVEKEG